MITLENNASLPQARCLLTLEARGDSPAISIITEPVREEVNGEWIDSRENVRQTLSCFIDGKPFKLAGKLAAAYAVECAACARVLVEIEVKMVLSTAYEKGDKSKESAQLSLVRVVEVWGTKAKKLWSAEDAAKSNGHAPAASMDASGRIQKPEGVATR